MFGFSKKKKLPKNPDSRQYKYMMAEMVSGKHIRYVTERRDNVEEVIGRNGSIGVKDEYIVVNSEADIVFRCRIEDSVISELLSKDGVMLSGPDETVGGAYRTVIAFYVYYR